MVLLGGRGSKAAKRALFGRTGVIAVMREHHPTASLPLVAQYKHLGVMVGTSFLTELRARCASAWAAYRQGRVRAYSVSSHLCCTKGSSSPCHGAPTTSFWGWCMAVLATRRADPFPQNPCLHVSANPVHPSDRGPTRHRGHHVRFVAPARPHHGAPG